jgi:hypothetical protein
MTARTEANDPQRVVGTAITLTAYMVRLQVGPAGACSKGAIPCAPLAHTFSPSQYISAYGLAPGVSECSSLRRAFLGNVRCSRPFPESPHGLTPHLFVFIIMLKRSIERIAGCELENDYAPLISLNIGTSNLTKPNADHFAHASHVTVAIILKEINILAVCRMPKDCCVSPVKRHVTSFSYTGVKINLLFAPSSLVAVLLPLVSGEEHNKGLARRGAYSTLPLAAKEFMKITALINLTWNEHGASFPNFPHRLTWSDELSGSIETSLNHQGWYHIAGKLVNPNKGIFDSKDA